MAKGTLAVQCELIQLCNATTTLHTVTWVPAELKPKVGMILVEGKDDKRVWEVAKAYTNSPLEFDSINTSWK